MSGAFRFSTAAHKSIELCFVFLVQSRKYQYVRFEKNSSDSFFFDSWTDTVLVAAAEVTAANAVVVACEVVVEAVSNVSHKK